MSTIRMIAYDLWEKSGRPEGMADHFWYEAEKKQIKKMIIDSVTQTKNDFDCKRNILNKFAELFKKFKA